MLKRKVLCKWARSICALAPKWKEPYLLKAPCEENAADIPSLAIRREKRERASVRVLGVYSTIYEALWGVCPERRKR